MLILKYWLRRGLDGLLGRDKHMRIRTRQGALAAVLMVTCVAVMLWLVSQGVADSRIVGLWAAFCVGGLLVFFGLIRSGVSLRWSDPSLAFAQILFAIACNAVAFVIAGHARGATLALLAVTLMFGIFGISMRQVMVLAVYALVLFAGAIAYMLENPNSDEGPAVYASYLFMVFIVLSGTTNLTWRLGQMRQHMRRQRAQLTQALEKIQQIATRDELTGTANRRFMQEQIRREIQRFRRTGAPVMIALLDIDYFKRVNDTYGHQAGDRCLQVFAEEVQASIRSNDILARWGGEEFLILLTDTDFVFGMACLERVRARVAAAVVRFGDEDIRLTVSIGVTQYVAEDSIEKTLDRADLALYAAKAQGRNQIVSA